MNSSLESVQRVTAPPAGATVAVSAAPPSLSHAARTAARKRPESEMNQAWSELSGSASAGASATDSYHAGEPLAEPPPTYTHPRKNWRLKRSAVPQWYKQRHGVRATALSKPARSSSSRHKNAIS